MNFKKIADTSFKVYDVIKGLNKNLITHLLWYLEKAKSYDIETLSIDRVRKNHAKMRTKS